MPSFLSGFLSRVSSSSSSSASSENSVDVSILSLSPKKFLSQVIAGALQEFFVIDNPQEQIQLLSNNNRIVLQHLKLKPQTVLQSSTEALHSTGEVEHVELAWVWGGNDQTSLIREIVLLVQGVKVTVVKTAQDGKEDRLEKSPPPDSSTARDAESYLQRYVQQIIDHLTLKITDLQITVQVQDPQSLLKKQDLVVVLQSLCLLSLGKRDDSQVLSQRVSVDRFAVDTIQDDQRRPLLEPFGYAADVTRKSGKRFQDGFFTGLEVTGQVFYDTAAAAVEYEDAFGSAACDNAVDTTSNGRWVLRLGKPQAKVICDCIEMFSKFQTVEGIDQSESDNLQFEAGNDGDQSDAIASNQPTLIVLPLPALSFVFENNLDSDRKHARIDLPDCVFSCRLDMSLCQVKGSGTISIDDTCPLLQLPNGAEWILDGVAKSMVVRPPSNHASTADTVVAHLNLDEAPLRRLLTSIMEIATAVQECTPSVNKDELWKDMEHALTEEWKTWQDRNQMAVFLFASEGNTSLRMSSVGANGSEEWVDALLRASSFSIRSDGSIHTLRMGQFMAGPTSFGEASLIMPAGVLRSNAEPSLEFHLLDTITATIQSIEVARNLRDFFMKMASVASAPEYSSVLSKTENIKLPFSVFVPSVNGSMASPRVSLSTSKLVFSQLAVGTIEVVDAAANDFGTVAIKGMKIDFSNAVTSIRDIEVQSKDSGGSAKIQALAADLKTTSVSIQSLAIESAESGEAKCQGVAVDIKSQTVLVDSIDSFNFTGYFELGEPMKNTKLLLGNSSLQIKLDFMQLIPTYDPSKVSRSSTERGINQRMLLPWPVHIEIEGLRVNSSVVFPSVLKAKSIGFELSTDATGIIKLALQKELVWQIDRSGHYLRMAAKGMVAEIGTTDLSLKLIQGTNLRLLASSFGDTKVQVQAVSFSNNQMAVLSDVMVNMPSQAVAEKLLEFVQGLATSSFACDDSSNASTTVALSFPLNVSKVVVKISGAQGMSLTLENIAVAGVTAQVGAFEYKDMTGVCASGAGIRLTISSATQTSLQQLHIPEIVNCTAGTNLDNSQLKIQLGSIALELPEIQYCGGNKMDSYSQLPFPVHFLAESVHVKVGGTGFDIATEMMDLVAKPCGNILHLEHSGQLIMKAVHKGRMEIIEVGLGEHNGDPIQLAVNVQTLKVMDMRCQSLQVGTFSFGQIVARVPSVKYDLAANAFVVEGEVNAYVENIEGAMKLRDTFQPLVNYFVDVQSQEPGYAVNAPKALVLTENPAQTRILLENVVYDGTNTAQIEQIHVHEKISGASTMLSGIKATIKPFAATVGLVEAMKVPGLIGLLCPVEGIRIWYQNGIGDAADELTAVLPNIKMVLLQPRQASGTTLLPPPETADPLEMPCNFKCSIESLSLLDTRYASAAPTVFEKVFGTAQLPPKDPFHPLQDVPKKVILIGSFEKMQNDMLILNNGQFRADIMDTTCQEFQNMYFQAKNGMASAGFSSVDWDSMFLGGKNINPHSTVIHLPLCCIEPLELGLKYQGVMVGTETRIILPKFVGNQQTTTNDVIQHFKSAILRRAPAFLAKANVLGANVGDSAASTAGMIVMAGSSAMASTGAGVAGIVAYDGVVAAIRSGKAARGVSEHETYQFGDITRGSVRAMGSLRTGGSGVVSSSAREYAKNNSSRLGGAAGSSVGMIAGAALLGPVGLIGGAVVGARAGARAFRNSQASQCGTVSNESEEIMPPPQQGPVDLLDDSFGVSTIAPPVASFAPMSMHDVPVQSQQRVYLNPQEVQQQQYSQQQYAPQYQQQQQCSQQPQQNSQQQQNAQQQHAYAEQSQQLQQHAEAQQYPLQNPLPQQQSQQQQGYRFGDLTRKVISKGKAKDGRTSQDGYKFGDFTRGLFK